MCSIRALRSTSGTAYLSAVVLMDSCMGSSILKGHISCSLAAMKASLASENWPIEVWAMPNWYNLGAALMLDHMHVWNHNSQTEMILGYGIIAVPTGIVSATPTAPATSDATISTQAISTRFRQKIALSL